MEIVQQLCRGLKENIQKIFDPNFKRYDHHLPWHCPAFQGPGANHENTITAQGFRLVDKNGKTRAALGFTTDGYPILAFLNSKGKPYSYFTGTKIGSSVRFFDHNSVCRLSLAVAQSGNPLIILRDPSNTARMIIGSNQDENTSILIT